MAPDLGGRLLSTGTIMVTCSAVAVELLEGSDRDREAELLHMSATQANLSRAGVPKAFHCRGRAPLL